MTPVTDLRSLYKKYVTQYKFIEVLEHDLPPPRLHAATSSSYATPPNLYPALDYSHQDFSAINTVCNSILVGVYKNKHIVD
ncbi:Clas67 [Clostera anastomosis granulovirus B]|uniref:Clas67 n=1 Tax=Clostera anastomosis granulovirus B TaxID=1986290 RepID=A0A0K0WS74_9BBAC|nr:Clas67 [Clostera anastomosis granulovirus B]AKS25410.1 Clas67 [Clostera anastomosis granulovirus B]